MKTKKQNITSDVGVSLMYAQRGITLIALIITIIIMLILAGVVLSLTVGENGLFKISKYAVQKNSEETAREKLELALSDLQARKYTDVENYNEKGYINNYLINEGMSVEGNIVTVDGYKFEIDRTIPQIKENLGQSEIILTKEVTKYLGKNANDKYEVQALITIESKKEIEEVIIKKQDKTIQEIISSENKQKIVKDITIELDEEYKATIKTIDGKTEEKAIIENSIETIKNEEELVAFGEKVNKGLTYEGKTISLENDINLVGSNSNRNWKSIGNSLEDKYFSGVFEGNNHKISEIYNEDTTEGTQGFFGYVKGGTVQNLGIESGHILGKYSVGGIAGKIDNGNIINCYNKTKIECLDSEADYGGMRIGGITGYAIKTTITQCYNDGEINGNLNTAGGIVGRVDDKTNVVNCYNTGSVTANAYIGGIIGFTNENENNSINNCYNTGKVTAKSFVGGLIGSLYKGNEINNSYNIGTVNGNDMYVGGVIGENKGAFKNLFYINTSGPEWGCGINDTEYGLEEAKGSSEETLKGLTTKFNEGQEGEPWKEDEDNINGGYPILSWQKAPNTNG